MTASVEKYACRGSDAVKSTAGRARRSAGPWVDARVEASGVRRSLAPVSAQQNAVTAKPAASRRPGQVRERIITQAAPVREDGESRSHQCGQRRIRPETFIRTGRTTSGNSPTSGPIPYCNSEELQHDQYSCPCPPPQRCHRTLAAGFGRARVHGDCRMQRRTLEQWIDESDLWLVLTIGRKWHFSVWPVTGLPKRQAVSAPALQSRGVGAAGLFSTARSIVDAKAIT